MSRLSDREKEIIKNKIREDSTKGDKEIADQLDFSCPVRCASSLRRGLETKGRFPKISEMDRANVRKLIKMGKSDEEISSRLGIGIESVQMIRKRISQKKEGKSLFPHGIEYPNSEKLDNNQASLPTENIDMKQLMEIFKETARTLSKESDKAGYLLFREKSQGLCPREIDAQLVMSNILSRYKYYHMMESPTVESSTQGFIDLSIYGHDRSRLVDIEFKEQQSLADRDFPKLAVSPAVGSAVFFISNHDNIEFVLPQIASTYNEIHRRIFTDIAQELISDKWFIFLLMAFKEKRIFLSFFKSIKSVDFNQLLSSEIKE